MLTEVRGFVLATMKHSILEKLVVPLSLTRAKLKKPLPSYGSPLTAI